MSEGFTRREMIGASAVALTLASVPAGAAEPEAARSPRRRERLERWRFHLGHAADVEKDFGFGRDQQTFAKSGWNTADAAMAKFDDSGWAEVIVPHDWAVALPFAAPISSTVFASASARLAATVTRAPRLARNAAKCRPRPLEPPVTSTCLSSSENMSAPRAASSSLAPALTPGISAPLSKRGSSAPWCRRDSSCTAR